MYQPLSVMAASAFTPGALDIGSRFANDPRSNPILNFFPRAPSIGIFCVGCEASLELARL